MGRGFVETNREHLPVPGATAVVLDQYSLWLAVVKLPGGRGAGRATLFICGLERGALPPAALHDLLGSASSVPGLITLVVGSNDEPEFDERHIAPGAYEYVL